MAAATTQAMGITNFATGTFTGAGAVVTVTLGFKPRYIKIFNLTDALTWEKIEGMGATQTNKIVTTAVQTTDTTSAITIGTDGTFAVTAALAANAKSIAWMAIG